MTPKEYLMKRILSRLLGDTAPLPAILSDVPSQPWLQARNGQLLIHRSYKNQMLEVAMEFAAVSQLEGDYLEFGVYQGDSFAAAFHFAQRKNIQSMRFYAFDSFQGLPEITGIDAEGFRQFTTGDFACDVNTFRENMSRGGVDLRKVIIVPGWYNEVLNAATRKSLPIKKAAIILIDCDLHASTIPVLNFVREYLQEGTVLLFDDWFCFRADPKRGQQRAFADWLEQNPCVIAMEYQKFGVLGNSFIIRFST